MDVKEAIKSYAYGLGADLIGFGDIGRCRHAPPMMSPQGLFPGAKTVIVMGIHHPDACIELGGEEHPQKIGAYSVQYLMNSRLDELSYRLATRIEELGYGAIPICSSNIWRYNQYKDLKAVFAPDVSHIYMSVVAGLSDMGYNGLALTPEYGARNRFVTVITDMEIAPDPLIPPGTICDKCMLCRKHCPSLALSKELDGEKVLRIDDYEYRFANKNLWRCAWGEHFDLDLDLEIPEKVTEEVIVDNVKKYGVRSGEMGQCLKFCVPQAVRSFDKSYSKTPMRRYAIQWDETIESRAVTDKLLNDCYKKDIEYVVVQSAASLKAQGIDIADMLPGAESAITLVRSVPAALGATRDEAARAAFCSATDYHIDSVGYDLTRDIEFYGFRSLMTIAASASHYDPMGLTPVNRQIGDKLFGAEAGKAWRFNTVFTRKKFAERPFAPPASASRACVPTAYRHGADLTGVLKDYAKSVGADLVGVASAARIVSIATQLKPIYDGQI
ncbi:MAG: epoxyqueuosine reductase, partial [Lentisphaerae bacterium]|nr:epoxyqueuosine reductase [Lentisphaerota bacterium]